MTRSWLDYWVGDATLAFMFSDLYLLAMDPSTTVNSQTCFLEGKMIRVPQFKRWSHQHLSNDLNTLFTLLQLVNLFTSTPDVRQWKLKENGLFIVNFLYRSLTGYRNETKYFRWIELHRPLLKSRCTWLLYHDRLLTVDNVVKRDIHITSTCIFCGVHPETNAHIFLQCPLTLDLWVSERTNLALSSWPSSIAFLWGDWKLSNIHIMQLIDRIVLSLPPFGYFGKNGTERFFMQNLPKLWCLDLEGGFHLW